MFTVVIIFTDTDGARTNKQFLKIALDEATKLFQQYSVMPGLIAFNMASAAVVASLQQAAAQAK